MQNANLYREQLCAVVLVLSRHPVQRARKEEEPLRRPHSPRKIPMRKSVSIYTLLRSAAYDMICERKIPAA